VINYATFRLDQGALEFIDDELVEVTSKSVRLLEETVARSGPPADSRTHA
jgi:predicted membrane GTPase involved in stress response